MGIEARKGDLYRCLRVPYVPIYELVCVCAARCLYEPILNDQVNIDGNSSGSIHLSSREQLK